MEKNYQEQETFAIETLHTDFGIPREAIHLERVDQHHASLWSVNVRLDQDFIVAHYNMGRAIAVLVSRTRGKLVREDIGYLTQEGA